MLAIINVPELRADKFIRLWEHSGKQDNLNPVLMEFTI